jgi:hypothetical protein
MTLKNKLGMSPIFVLIVMCSTLFGCTCGRKIGKQQTFYSLFLLSHIQPKFCSDPPVMSMTVNDNHPSIDTIHKKEVSRGVQSSYIPSEDNLSSKLASIQDERFPPVAGGGFSSASGTTTTHQQADLEVLTLSAICKIVMFLDPSFKTYLLFLNTAPVDMGITQYFAVFGKTGFVPYTMTSGTLNGAVSSGTSFTLESTLIVNGVRFISDATTLQVAVDLAAAMADCSGRANQIELASNNFNGMVLTPGVYFKASIMYLGWDQILTLDANNDPNAVWIFNIGGVGFGNRSKVKLINYPGSDMPVWWNVGGLSSGISIESGAVVIGHIMSVVKINVLSGNVASVGALLSLASVTMNQQSSIFCQARTYPNSYVGVIGE